MAVLKKHHRRNFTVVDNNALRDTALSWKATGLLAYLLGLPDDWRVNVSDLTNRKTDGRSSTMTAMVELEDVGYVRRVKIQDQRGRWTTFIHVAESPELLGEIADQPMLDLPISEEPTVGESHTTKEREERNTTKHPETLIAPRDEVWDALADLFGEPTTETNRTLRGKLTRSLKNADATGTDIRTRYNAWPFHFENTTITETALEKHWDRLGRPPARMSAGDVEKYQSELRQLAERKRAVEMGRGLPA